VGDDGGDDDDDGGIASIDGVTKTINVRVRNRGKMQGKSDRSKTSQISQSVGVWCLV